MPSRMVDFRCEATRVLSEIKKGSTFLTVRHYTNNFGEICDFSVVFHISYHNAVDRSLRLLEAYNPVDADCVGKRYCCGELRLARLELLDSFRMTLTGYNPLATSVQAYSLVDDGSGSPINGIKLHDRQDILHLNAFRVYRNLLQKGSYPEDRRAAKTVAKDDLRSKLPVGRYVQFKLTPGKFHHLVVAGITLHEQDVVRSIMNKMG